MAFLALKLCDANGFVAFLALKVCDANGFVAFLALKVSDANGFVAFLALKVNYDLEFKVSGLCSLCKPLLSYLYSCFGHF